ncbi:MAG: MerR family transcriptional regulator, partial [Calditrichales bacterium]|nr:MerR family transcriptional regulator [Calditrichales bacterium]
MEEYINISKAAKRIGVSKETLRRWDKSGKFNSIRHPINNYRVYKTEQVESLVKEIQFEYTTETVSITKHIEPYFQTNRGKFYDLDAVSFLKTIENETVDLIIADPPYNIKKAE